MAWSSERAQLTLDYRRRHSDATASDLAIEPRLVVVHYTAGNSAAGTRAYFDNPKIEASRKALFAAGAVNVSAHFVVDRDGTIVQLQPTTRFARHCIGLNHIAIGIENVGDDSRGSKFPLTDAQVVANAALIRHLRTLHTIEHVVGHHEVSDQTPYFTEREPGYRNDKPDPGARFMTALRAALAAT